MKFFFGFLFVILFTLSAEAQLADFVVSPSLCLNQTVKLQNTSTGAASYLWDFCHDGLKNPTSSILAFTANASEIPEGIEIVNDNGIWYGFFFGRNSNNLYRLAFGSDLNNTSPTLTNLGNLGSLFDLPTHIRIVKDNSNWYGLVVNFNNSNLIKLNFGNLLGANPIDIVSTTVGSYSFANPRGMDITPSESGYVAFISSWTSNSNLLLIRFSDGLNSSPTDIRTVPTSISKGLGASLIKDNGKWFGLIAGSGDITHINFGTDLFEASFTPEQTALTSLAQPRDLKLIKDGMEFYAIVETTFGLTRIEFGSDLLIDGNEIITSIGNFNSSITDPFGLSLVRDGANWTAFTIGQTSGEIHKVNFQDVCSEGGISFNTLITESPTQIFFKQAGIYQIDLIAYNLIGGFATKEQLITVTSLNAPALSFLNNNSCLGQLNEFQVFDSNGATLSNSTWDFGNGNTATGNTSSFQFPTVGSWPVIVRSTASTGCANLYSGLINIYNPPVASFSLPLASTLCTNQILAFTNTSNFDLESNPNWSWSINGVTASSSKDLNTTFNSTVTQSIQLIASISGCSSQATSPFAVQQQGPLVDFVLPPYGCQSTLLPLINTTSGAVTSYSWVFGDGNNSSLQNPSNTFLGSGAFSVSLQATNAAGCQNSATKAITIYSKPQPNFSIGLPPFSCSGSPSQFTDLTPLPTDSNIASWTWGFGDAANGLAILKNPAYTYSASGSYNVSLAVATNFGCTNSIQKSVTVAQSPVAGYSNLPACANQLTQFTDTSTGSIKSRLWQLGINTFTIPNPQFSFSSSGSFPVTLTITGNNNCVSQISKNINVPIPPSLDFSVEVPCTNSSTLFREITNSADPSISQSWAFGTVASGSGSPAQNIFASPGNFAVRLSSTRQSGCVYSISKSVAIVNSPVADFFPSTDAGAAPLGVLFANQSTFASSYLWKFRDSNNLTSSLANPFFVFTDLGDYDIELTASNSVGCSSKANKIISVVIPRIDAVMTDFFFVKDPTTNSLQPVIKVLNKSNVSIVDPSILIDVAGSSVVQKKIIGIVRPNQELTQTLDFQIVPRTNYYVCAEVQVAGDTDLFLNRKCLSLSNDEILFTPFPNPAQAELNLDWISVNGDPVDFQIVTRAGSVCLQQTVGNVVKGINRLVVNTSALPAGIYYIRYRDSKLSKTFSFVVSGN